MKNVFIFPCPPTEEVMLCWTMENGQQKMENGKCIYFSLSVPQKKFGLTLGWCQDNGNRSNQESKFDFLATRQRLGKIDEGQQKIKICWHHPSLTRPLSADSVRVLPATNEK